MTSAPEYNNTDLVVVPINAILNWPMVTTAGFAAFLNDKVNTLFKVFSTIGESFFPVLPLVTCWMKILVMVGLVKTQCKQYQTSTKSSNASPKKNIMALHHGWFLQQRVSWWHSSSSISGRQFHCCECLWVGTISDLYSREKEGLLLDEVPTDTHWTSSWTWVTLLSNFMVEPSTKRTQVPPVITDGTVLCRAPFTRQNSWMVPIILQPTTSRVTPHRPTYACHKDT